MNLKECINELKNGLRHYKLVAINQESLEYVNQCKEINNDDVEKINITKLLLSLLEGKNDDVKCYDSWKITKNYLNTINKEIFIIYDVDYLFSPELGNQDVINNFNYFSRNNNITILFIKGKLDDNYLIHSEEGCPDYKKMDVSKVELLGWDL